MSEKQKSEGTLCPRCKKNKYTPYSKSGKWNPSMPPFPALSRRDNKTNICSDCGTREAMEDAGYEPKWTGEIYWKIKK
jgi:hypothetical protein